MKVNKDESSYISICYGYDRRKEIFYLSVRDKRLHHYDNRLSDEIQEFLHTYDLDNLEGYLYVHTPLDLSSLNYKKDDNQVHPSVPLDLSSLNYKKDGNQVHPSVFIYLAEKYNLPEEFINKIRETMSDTNRFY